MLNLLQEKVVTNHFMLSLPSYIFYLNYLRPTIENGIKCNANFFEIESRDQFQ